MTFVRKYSGDRTKPIVAVYTCPEHGEFDATVERDENGEAPDFAFCPVEDERLVELVETGRVKVDSAEERAEFVRCDIDSPWTPSPVGCRVRRVEVVRGNWEKPERKTYLDTRKLGEGQDIDEFRAERKKVWDEERRKTVKELLE